MFVELRVALYCESRVAESWSLGIAHMHSKAPAIIFLPGVGLILFSRQITAGVGWLDGKIWTEKRRRRFPGHGGNSYKPWMAVMLGASWIVCAIFFWFTAR